MHTPGPWRLNKDGHDIYAGKIAVACITHDYDGRTTPLSFQEHNEIHANAQLIAAAPDLLAMCEQLLLHAEAAQVSEWGEVRIEYPTMKKARVVIAKAKGIT